MAWAIVLIYGTFTLGAFAAGALGSSFGRGEFISWLPAAAVAPAYLVWLFLSASLGLGPDSTLYAASGVIALLLAHGALLYLAWLCVRSRRPAREILCGFIGALVLAQGVLVGASIRAYADKQVEPVATPAELEGARDALLESMEESPASGR